MTDEFLGVETKRVCQGDSPDEPPFWEQINNYSAHGSYPGVTVVQVDSEVDRYADAGTDDERQTSYQYDAYGNVVTVAEYGAADDAADDRFTSYTYTYNTDSWIVNQVAKTVVEDTAGTAVAETQYYYDGHANLTAPPDRGDLTCRTEVMLESGTGVSADYEYDDYGNLTGVTDPKGNETTTAYDGTYHTFPVQETYPSLDRGELSSTSAFDPRWGVVTESTDLNGQTTTYEYDVHGRLTEVWEPQDSGSGTPTVENVYHDGQSRRMVEVRQKEQYGSSDTLREWTFYDGGGSLLQSQSETDDPNRVVIVDYSYDHKGRVSRVSVPYEVGQAGGSYRSPENGQPQARYTYDSHGRVTRVENPDGSQVQTYYRGWRSKTVRDARGYLTSYTFDGHERTTRIQEFSHTYFGGLPYATTHYTYDALDRLVQVTDTEDNVTTVTYDSLGRKTAMDDPDLGQRAYTYDDNDNLVTQTDARGVVITTTWDAWDRPTSKTYSDGTPPVTFTYDQGANGIGRLTSVSTGTVQRHYTYDVEGRVVTEGLTVNGTPYTTGYAYDPLDRLRTTTYPSGESVTQSYDGGGLLETLSGHVDYVTHVDYNAVAQPTHLTLGNGRSTNYEYEPASFRLKRLVTGGGLQDLNYSYDVAGNLTGFYDGVLGVNLGYSYDFLDRLVSVDGTFSRLYGYDRLGNLIEKAGVTQAYTDTLHVHAITARSDGRTCSYDANGNMTDRDGQTLTWDAENRPTEVVSGTTTIRYTYDGEGTQVKQEVVGGETTVYAGPHFEVEISGTQVISTSYYYALGQAIAMRRGDQVYYLHGDHLGGTHVVSDEDGARVERIGYLPFGEMYAGDGEFVTDRLFTGQRQDVTGLYHYGAREYDPVSGRFTQPDPIVPNLFYPQDLNRYTYVRNNPLYYVDDGGQIPVVAVPVAAGLLLLKVVDYGWTTWDMAQATWTLTDPCASPADQFWAGLTIVLAAGFEIAEFDEWLQINLPLDDIARRQLMRELKQAAGDDGFAQVARVLREELGDDAAERVLRALEPLLGRESGGGVLRRLDLSPNQIGRLGEEAAGIRGPKMQVDSLTGTAFFRVPDEVVEDIGVLREVKNVASLSNTKQLRDYLLWAEKKGYVFELIVRENKGAVVGTRLSKTLQALEQEGRIVVRRELPW